MNFSKFMPTKFNIRSDFFQVIISQAIFKIYFVFSVQNWTKKPKGSKNCLAKEAVSCSVLA